MRWSPDILALAAVIAVSAALFVVVLAPPGAESERTAELGGPWERWLSLGLDARRAYLEEYALLSHASESSRVLEHGRRFSSMPAARQAHLRRLQRALEEFKAELTELERNELRGFDARTRAVLLHDWLLRTHPERVARLRTGEVSEPGQSIQPPSGRSRR